MSSPPTPDFASFKTDKKITDEEILRLLEQPLAKATSTKSKSKKKKKKPAKPVEVAKAEVDEEAEEEASDDE